MINFTDVKVKIPSLLKKKIIDVRKLTGGELL